MPGVLGRSSTRHGAAGGLSVYRLGDIALTVTPPELEARARLPLLCTALTWQPACGELGSARHHIALRLHGHGAAVPAGATVVYHTDGFRVFQDDRCSYVSDGASMLRVRVAGSEAEAFLDESFHQKPRALQWQFWSFCILKLLRPAGYFSLHAASLVAPGGTGLLIVGPPGSGKSTLAVGLIRAGWGYLSDDAVLVFSRGDAIAAVPLRTNFYIDSDAAHLYADLRLGDEIPDAAGRGRRELHIDDRHGDRRASRSVPGVLICPTIAAADSSRLVPLDAASSLRELLAASGPQLFDRAHMPAHMAALRAIVRQSVAYRLDAGRDLRDRPARVLDLLPDGGRL